MGSTENNNLLNLQKNEYEKQNECKHNMVLKLKDWDYKLQWNEAYCLDCKKFFREPFSQFNYKFKNIIHAESFARNNNISDEEMFEYAYTRYKELNNLGISDKEIVKIINSEIDAKQITLKLKKDN